MFGPVPRSGLSRKMSSPACQASSRADSDERNNHPGRVDEFATNASAPKNASASAPATAASAVRLNPGGTNVSHVTRSPSASRLYTWTVIHAATSVNPTPTPAPIHPPRDSVRNIAQPATNSPAKPPIRSHESTRAQRAERVERQRKHEHHRQDVRVVADVDDAWDGRREDVAGVEPFHLVRQPQVVGVLVADIPQRVHRQRAQHEHEGVPQRARGEERQVR